ncbi:MAG: hypothetical protein Q9202_000432 [Teloschistes flavicans]
MGRPPPFLAQSYCPAAERPSSVHAPSSVPIRKPPAKKGILARLGRSVFGHQSSQETSGSYSASSADKREPWVLIGHGNIRGSYDGPVESMTYQQGVIHSEELNLEPPWERTWRRHLALETFIYEQIAKHEHIAADAVKLTMNDQEYCYYMRMEHGSARGDRRKSRLDHAVEAFPEDQQMLNQELLSRVYGPPTGLDDSWGWYRPTVIPKRQGRGFNYYWVDEYGEPLLTGRPEHYNGRFPTIPPAT